MNSEHPNEYTAEEMASTLFQSSPVELHAQYGSGVTFDTTASPTGFPTRSPLKLTAVLPEDFTTDREGDHKVAVGYVRRDVYDAQAARVAELEQQIAGCATDLAKLDQLRAPQKVFVILQATNRGGVPVGFAFSEPDAIRAVDASADANPGAAFRYATLPRLGGAE